METFIAIEPKTVIFVLINILLWFVIGFIIYNLIRKKK